MDLILTNQPNDISDSGVIDLGISDHGLIYVAKKMIVLKSRQTRHKVRNFKRFSEIDFIQELSGIPWYETIQFSNPNDC